MTNGLPQGNTMHNNNSRPAIKRIVSRRSALGLLGFGAAAALTPTLSKMAQAQNQTQNQPSSPAQNQPSQIITKEIPRTKEKLPAIGLGTFMTFDALSNQPRASLGQVMRRFWDAGGRVVDTSPLYGMSEVNVSEFARTLGLTNDLFVTNKTWATGEYLGDPSQAQRQFEQSLKRLSRDRIDVMQVHSLVNVDAILPLLKAWKKEGKIRFVGVTHHDPLYFAALEKWIENGDLDFVQLRYSIRQREVEERILPAAAARGTAVLANMPFEKARLFELVKGQSLPDFASEIGCQNWAQFFLKYVISHPALTCAIPATTNPNHVVENMGALRGSLPDKSMRTRMVKHMESLPGFEKLLQTPWYPGKTFNGLVRLPNPRPIG
ncbi:aldo/keto reductase [Brasilonema octagenarum UFV-E1]|uniref:Aldo/keto reductase n=2 Tax=Brasilonema TaxID=383614 RepID=A0A856MAT0_9CYAN|nr:MULTISPECIES: aldo/keto reductase [Brasilonema]NMF63338.1 aldo/keto reductase [Brasilonema octagenarum UFV-OR1]QDL08335.1 aldo/keto reductase [Brasilonema sennae CENA114]QDL14690.1 aldo/keto reductase [Brasilonema octagenarum UFV-E1]